MRTYVLLTEGAETLASMLDEVRPAMDCGCPAYLHSEYGHRTRG